MRQMQAKRPRTILLNSAATVALIAALSGCATTMDSSGRSASSTRTAYTPAEKQLRQESSLFSKTSAQGCLAGAVAGALIGMLATHNSDNRNRNRALRSARPAAVPQVSAPMPTSRTSAASIGTTRHA